MEIRWIGIDLGKTTFHRVALGRAGKVLVRKQFTKRQLLTYTAKLQTCLIGLECCAAARIQQIPGIGPLLGVCPRRCFK
jgi:transposase